jgi:hypothetical protein
MNSKGEEEGEVKIMMIMMIVQCMRTGWDYPKEITHEITSMTTTTGADVIKIMTDTISVGVILGVVKVRDRTDGERLDKVMKDTMMLVVTARVTGIQEVGLRTVFHHMRMTPKVDKLWEKTTASNSRLGEMQ